ncbi:MAG: hypothetical protein LAO19_21460 [Acidobacteriia bacterium]|nr:hypothetical protein [Terriglobia bacterium]
MKLLQLSHDDKQGALQLKGTYANETHYDHVVDDDTVVLTPNGDVLAVLVAGVISPRARRGTYIHLRTIYGMPSNRATAVYRGSSLPRIRKRDGSLSRTREVPHSILALLHRKGVRADVLGYLDATPRIRRCRLSSWSLKNPEVLRGIRNFVHEVDDVFRSWIPDRYFAQLGVVHRVPGWYLHGTAFTTITVNKNFRTAYHTDKGDLKVGFSTLTTLGKFSGGLLVIPRYRVAFDVRPGSVLMMDAHQFHPSATMQLPIS